MINSYLDILRLKWAFIVHYWWIIPILFAWAIFVVCIAHKWCEKEEK